MSLVFANQPFLEKPKVDGLARDLFRESRQIRPGKEANPEATAQPQGGAGWGGVRDRHHC